MAYLERADERDHLVLCNICNVNCSERKIMAHKSTCAIKHSDKFKNGLLTRCQFDSGHIVQSDKYQLHLEFCNKRQSEILGEYQHANRKNALAQQRGDVPTNKLCDSTQPASQVSDDWNQQANHETFTLQMSKLNIGRK